MQAKSNQIGNFIANVIAPNAPQQNPVEDIWLQAKTYIRQHYYRCPSFKSLGQLFMQFLDGRVFDFPKLRSYG